MWHYEHCGTHMWFKSLTEFKRFLNVSWSFVHYVIHGYDTYRSLKWEK